MGRAHEGERGWRRILKRLDLCVSPRCVCRWERSGAHARAEVGMGVFYMRLSAKHGAHNNIKT